MVSQAHPHGESVAMACDLLAIAMAELGAIAERRLDRLVNPLVSGLPAFLVARPGVNSGMMIAQYVAASLCAENKQLAQPAVLDNFVTSALQEDHLSLGTSAALKLQRLLGNLLSDPGYRIFTRGPGARFSRAADAGGGYASGARSAAPKRAWLGGGSLAGTGHRQRSGYPQAERWPRAGMTSPAR